MAGRQVGNPGCIYYLLDAPMFVSVEAFARSLGFVLSRSATSHRLLVQETSREVGFAQGAESRLAPSCITLPNYIPIITYITVLASFLKVESRNHGVPATRCEE